MVPVFGLSKPPVFAGGDLEPAKSEVQMEIPEPASDEDDGDSEPASDEDFTTSLLQDPTGPPGQLYQGQFVKGMKHGTGVLHFDVAERGRPVYQGEFFLNKKHGHGVMEWQGGRNYQGQFLNDEFHGEGTMTWPDGNQYVGQYANGKKDGEGTWSVPDGSKFVGQFHEGKRHGKVTHVKADGTTRLLHFEMDKAYKAAKSSLDGEQTPTISDCSIDVVSSTSGSTHASGKDVFGHSEKKVGKRGPTTASPDRWRVVDPGGAVVRFSSSLKSQKVGKLRQKEELIVVQEEGRRLRVVSPVQGWVSKSTERGLMTGCQVIMVRVD